MGIEKVIEASKGDDLEEIRKAARDYKAGNDMEMEAGYIKRIGQYTIDETDKPRFVRENERQGLITSIGMQDGRFPADPEEKARIDNAESRLAYLNAKDDAIKSRYDGFIERAQILDQSDLILSDGVNNVMVPLVDASGQPRTQTAIQQDANSKLKNPHEKEEFFFVVGKNVDAVIVTKDFKSAEALNKATGLDVVVSPNLHQAAKSVQATFPGRPILVAGERGNTEATEVAKDLQNAKAVYPVFAVSENNTLKTFSDLSSKSSLGAAAIERQLNTAVRQVTNKPSLTSALMKKDQPIFEDKLIHSQSKALKR